MKNEPVSFSIGQLEDAISSVVSCEGFKKEGKSWRLQVNDVLHVVNLQKSQYGNQFYVNFGVCLDSASRGGKTRINLCHIQFRLESAVSEDGRSLAKHVLDLDSSMVGVERAKTLSALLRNGMEKMRRLSSKSAIRECLSQEGAKHILVLPGSLELLD